MADPCRTVLDTNIWISALVFRRRPFLSWFEEVFAHSEVLISPLLQREILEKIHSDKLREAWAGTDVPEKVANFLDSCISIPTQKTYAVCRDAQDNFILDLCHFGQATHLVTGDFDLHAVPVTELHPPLNLQIMQLRAFHEQFLT